MDEPTPGDNPAPTPTERQEHEDNRLYEAPLLTAKERKAERKRAFVELIASGCNFTEAAEALGVHRITAFQWRREDPGFNAECMQALRVSIDMLKKEAERRAIRGSDKLLMFLLERYDPEKFHLAQKLEHSGAVDLAGAVLAARRRGNVGSEPGSDLC
jgi:hypothetical protein